jgi:hypothetical protein
MVTLLAGGILIFTSLQGGAREQKRETRDPGVKKLYDELSNKGWIVCAAKTEKGDYDLFLLRPNGTGVRNITNTPGTNELGARFLPDGRKIMYRRVDSLNPKQDYRDLTAGVLMIANADGSNPVAVGKEGEFPGASLSPDAKQIACLYKKEGKIKIFDLETRRMMKEIPRQGIFMQLNWSPDGRELCGAANVEGRDWNIVTYGIDSGKLALISRVLNCTPDWFPDSTACIFSHRNPSLASDDGGDAAKKTGQDVSASWTMLMMADRAGKDRRLVVAEQYRHLYFACISPDSKYVIYCRPEIDGSLTGLMAVVRLADTPIIDGTWLAVEKQYARNAKNGPVLHLDFPPAFDPHWIYASLGGNK